MSQKPNGPVRNVSRQSNQQKVNRVIDENWQKLRACNLVEVKKEKSEEKKDYYTKVFRRTRKKCNDIPNGAKNVHNPTNNAHNKTNRFSQLLASDGEVMSMEFVNGNVSRNKNAVKNVKLKTTGNINLKKNVDSQQDIELQKKDRFNQDSLTKYIAIDCEMVGVGFEGAQNMLARVSLVNKFGDCIYDKFVKPRETIVNYRTEVSGIRREDLIHGEDFITVQKEVADILKNKIIVGHGVRHDLEVLLLKHPRANIRDTSFYKPFRAIKNGQTPSLKALAKIVLGADIQAGEHSSVEDAKSVMQVYCTVAKDWERSMEAKRRQRYIGKNPKPCRSCSDLEGKPF